MEFNLSFLQLKRPSPVQSFKTGVAHQSLNFGIKTSLLWGIVSKQVYGVISVGIVDLSAAAELAVDLYVFKEPAACFSLIHFPRKYQSCF